MQFIIALLVLVFALCAIAGSAYAIYYYVYKRQARLIPPLPPAPPPTETEDMVFFNSLSKAVWIIPVPGSTPDPNGWTRWQKVPNTLDSVYNPTSISLQPTKVEPGTQVQMKVLTGGMGSVKFTFRYNCDDATMICQYGDSVLSPIDYNPNGTLKRGSVPIKPAIDTTLELSWACAYTGVTTHNGNQEFCTINSSCIIPPSSGTNCYQTLQGYFADPAKYPDLRIEKDGLMYKTVDNTRYQVPLPANAILQGNTFFDLSCVDGFTIPIALQVKRPIGTEGSRQSKVITSGEPLDSVDDMSWITVADTRHLHLDFARCPTDEVIWPNTSALMTTTQLAGESSTTDGYNVNVTRPQLDIPWLTGPGQKLSSSFVHGSQFDLRVYRNPTEVASASGMLLGFSTNDIIGCAAPCSLLTKNGASSVIYPLVGGFYSTPSPYMNSALDVLLPQERGVADVCCGINDGAIYTSVEQCNTTVKWSSPPYTGTYPAPANVAVPLYNHGYYVPDVAPKPGEPWWDPAAGDKSRNPYKAGPKLKYIAAVRNGGQPVTQTTRAYSYVHDDSWCTLQTSTATAPSGVHEPTDYRGSFYNRYRVRVIIGDGPHTPPDD